jgi:hypothetical protein
MVNAVHVKCVATCRYLLKLILCLVVAQAYRASVFIKWAPHQIINAQN